MPLRSFTVENYRSFLRPTEIELRPLTLFFGYNSVGKSALLRFLPLLANSVGGGSGGPFALQSPAGRGATFADLRSRYGSSSVIRLSLAWDDDGALAQRASFAVRDMPERKRQVVDQLKVDEALNARWLPRESDALRTASRYEILGPSQSSAAADTIDLLFDGLLPFEASRQHGQADELLQRLRGRLRALAQSVHWIGALRSAPARWSLYNTPRTRLQQDGTGAGAIEVLAYDALEGGLLLEEVSQWYRSATRHQLALLTARDERPPRRAGKGPCRGSMWTTRSSGSAAPSRSSSRISNPTGSS